MCHWLNTYYAESIKHWTIGTLILTNHWVPNPIIQKTSSATVALDILTHWGRDKMAAVSQTTSLNAFPWMKMYEFQLKFHWNLFLRI